MRRASCILYVSAAVALGACTKPKFFNPRAELVGAAPAAKLELTSVSPSSIPDVGGTLLSLTGSGFETGMTVTVDGGPCTGVTVQSPTLLTCTAPAHAIGSVKVYVYGPGGASASLASGLVYTATTYAYRFVPGAGQTTAGGQLAVTSRAGGTFSPAVQTGGSYTVRVGGN